jgi:LmbE family N-acetylglucosaminyl deacetylase
VIATGLVAAAALAFASYWVRRRRYRRAFQLPVRRDDLLICRSDPETIPVALDAASSFEAPADLARRGQTAFLSLDVRADVRGHFVDPYVEVRTADVVYRQYFERGARGRRYLNLSPVFQAGDAGSGSSSIGRIQLHEEGLTCRRDAALTVHPALRPSAGDLLVLAPHPDDAEIAAFGMYAGRSAPATTPASWVVTITAGERGGMDLSEIVPDGSNATAWKAKLRMWDSLAIPGLGGVPRTRCLNLAYPDGRLHAMHADPAHPFQLACEAIVPRASLRACSGVPTLSAGDAACTWTTLIDDLRAILDTVRPAVIVAPHPLLDVHPDHVFTTVALDQALRGATGCAPLVLLYAIDVRDARLHPFGPADAVASLPPLTHRAWLADSVLSVPLDEEVRRAKYFAVTAAHDLRRYRAGAPRTLRRLLGAARSELSAFIAQLGRDPFSYQRRAPRPNEIYYVVSRQSLGALVARGAGAPSAT